MQECTFHPMEKTHNFYLIVDTFHLITPLVICMIECPVVNKILNGIVY